MGFLSGPTRALALLLALAAAPAQAEVIGYECEARMPVRQGLALAQIWLTPQGERRDAGLTWLPTDTPSAFTLSIDYRARADGTVELVRLLVARRLDRHPKQRLDVTVRAGQAAQTLPIYRPRRFPWQRRRNLAAWPMQAFAEPALLREIQLAPAVDLALVQADGKLVDRVQIDLGARTEAERALAEAWRDASAKVADHGRRCQIHDVILEP